MSAAQILIEYAASVRKQLLANPTNIEQDLAPCFKALLEKLLPLVPVTDLTVSSEWATAGVGRPDIGLTRPGQPPRAFVELKAPTKPDDPEKFKDPHDKRQYVRFQSLPVWALSNFSNLRLFERDELIWSGEIVPAKALQADTPDAKAARLVETVDPAPLLKAITRLALASPPSASNARELAANLAHAARLVRSIVEDALAELRAAGTEAHPLIEVRDVFRSELYSRPEAGGFSARNFEILFSAAFAQTLSFGLLLVREATNQPVTSAAWEKMPDEHPLMKAALRVLSQPEVVELLGVGFTVMLDTVNSFDEKLLAVKADGHDPILYFYEDFLEVFDPDGRKRYGVYYTPIEVVRYMVGALDRVLREDLKTDGLDDQNVTILDPATGTGTFLLGVAERLRADVEAKEGKPAARAALKNLMGRMFGFELLVGPYAVAHYRLHHTLAAPSKEDGAVGVDLPRLGVFLANTLAKPREEKIVGAARPLVSYIYSGIGNERSEADRIKQAQPVLAIIGNPPYRRLAEGENETLVGRWIDDMWDDLKQPVRDAGWGGQLNTFPELSVAFWRWAMWKLFESDGALGKGVIAYITNRTFLAGKPYAGLRKMMRERFDRIEIIDLRGDVRRGERAGIDGDQGVFNIQVGTAIAIAVADGSLEAARKTNNKGELEPRSLAKVRYTDSWQEETLTRRAKLDWLLTAAEGGRMAEAVAVDRGPLENMKPVPFSSVAWPSARDAFQFGVGGIQTKRDKFIYAVSDEALHNQISTFLRLSGDEARSIFVDSRDRKWVSAHAVPYDQLLHRAAAYRPLDNRIFYNHKAYGDFLRPELQAVWGESNLCLYTMSFGIGEGPAFWCHGLIPDYHAFSGRGGYAFPLYDRRPGYNPINLNSALLAGLAMAYGQPVRPEDAFDCMLALLSATSYTLRFAEDLEDVFPHIPFPSDHEVFKRAAAIGAEIRAVETFARKPGDAFLTPALARQESDATGVVADSIDLKDGSITLCADGSGRLSGIPEPIWQFAVSGYRLLPRWLAARAGQPVDRAFIKQVRDISGRIAELIDLFDRADIVLEEALRDTKTRAELGLEPSDSDNG